MSCTGSDLLFTTPVRVSALGAYLNELLGRDSGGSAAQPCEGAVRWKEERPLQACRVELGNEPSSLRIPPLCCCAVVKKSVNIKNPSQVNSL